MRFDEQCQEETTEKKNPINKGKEFNLEQQTEGMK